MQTDAKTPKQERLEARVTPEQKALIQRAANLAGCSLTDFIINNLQAAAEQTIRTHEVIELSARDSAAFAAALLTPSEPAERLVAAARRYRQFVGRSA